MNIVIDNISSSQNQNNQLDDQNKTKHIHFSNLVQHVSSIRFTESSNPLSQNIDCANPLECLQILSKVDGQMFAPHIDSTFSLNFPKQRDMDTLLQNNKIHQTTHTTHSTLYGTRFREQLTEWIQSTFQLIQQSSTIQQSTDHHHSTNTLIILSGAGTSGRIAFFFAQYFNKLYSDTLGQIRCECLIAGGPEAFVQAQEAAEDDPESGVTDLKDLLSTITCKNIIYIGITCGLSAIYVGQQLFYLLSQKSELNASISLLGFNPPSQARTTVFTAFGKHTTFAQILAEMNVHIQNKLSHNIHILTPIIGAEAITGSTRMKGGTATIIILATLLPPLFDAILKQKLAKSTILSKTEIQETVNTSLQSFYNIFKQFYSCAINNTDSSSMQQTLEITKTHCSTTENNLIYVSHSLLPIIDASECPPTFGASSDQVRGFSPSSWKELLSRLWYSQNTECPSLSFSVDFLQEKTNPRYHIEIQDLFPKSTPERIEQIPQTVELHHSQPQPAPVSQSNVLSPSSLILLIRDPCTEKEFVPIDIVKHQTHIVTLPKITNYFCRVLYLKWYLNSITVHGFTFSGKIFQNFMCDLKLTNIKLYQRAIFLSAKLAFNTNTPTIYQVALSEFYILQICHKNYENDEFSIQTTAPFPKFTLEKSIISQSSTLLGKPNSICDSSIWKPQILPLLPHLDSVSVISLTSSTPFVVSLTILCLLLPNKSLEELKLLLSGEHNIRKVLKIQGLK